VGNQYNATVYREQGGDALVVEAQDGGMIKGQAAAGGAAAQAAAIASVSGSPAPSNDELATAVDAILVAMRNAGLIAT